MRLQPIDIAWVSCLLLLTGMVYAPFLQSLSMFGLGVAAAMVLMSRLRKNGFSGDFQQASKRFFFAHGDAINRVSTGVITLHFAIVLIGVFYPMEDPGYWWERMRIKTPFLALPLIFWLLPPFSRRHYLGIWMFLLILLSLTSFGIIANYLLHMEEINLMIRRGQPMPMPCNHIRYSLLHTMGIAGGLYLMEQRPAWKEKAPRSAFAQRALQLIPWLTLWLIIAQHFLAVRSGLVVLYAVLAVAVLRYILLKRRYLAGAMLLLALAAAPVLAYQFVPSIRTKVGYMRYDLDRYRKGQDIGTLSDASRWISWKIGWDIWRSAPWTGVGPGNLRREVNRIYDERYPDLEKRLMPHNQFLHTAAGSGIIGLVLFIPAFFVPILYRRNYRHFPLLALHVSAFLSFLVEGTLENAMGVAYFLFFLVLGLNVLKGRDEVESY